MLRKLDMKLMKESEQSIYKYVSGWSYRIIMNYIIIQMMNVQKFAKIDSRMCQSK